MAMLVERVMACAAVSRPTALYLIECGNVRVESMLITNAFVEVPPYATVVVTTLGSTYTWQEPEPPRGL